MTEPVLIQRQRAAQACYDRYFGQYLDFAQFVHCGALVDLALRGVGREARVLRGARFTTRGGAVKWLKRQNYQSVMDAVDACGLERLKAPAFALPGDILAIPAPQRDAFGAALAVYLGGGRALGWGEADKPAGVAENLTVIAGWRLV